jgi:hypothetical protein
VSDESINLGELQVLPLERKDSIYGRHTEIEKLYDRRGRLVLDDAVGFCIDRARDAYILGMQDICSFLSGKSLEEALSFKYERKVSKNIPDLNCLIEWAKKENILDSGHRCLAHEVRKKRNDYGHAYLKILRKELKTSKGRQPFTAQEALGTFEKALRVLEYMYKDVTPLKTQTKRK